LTARSPGVPASAARRVPLPPAAGTSGCAQGVATGAKRPGRAGGRRPGPGATPPGGRPSRYYAKHVSALLPGDADTRLSRRHVRYAQRQILWRESRIERIRKCGRVPVDGVAIKDHAGVAHYSGLASCGSIWACSVCSAKIRNTRAGEISAAAAAWDQAGNSVYMVTLTMPHDFGMRLAALLSVAADGFRSVISGRAWAGTPERFVPERPSKRGGMLPAKLYPAKPGIRARVGIAGTIRSVEITHGINGWHPHLHVLIFIEGDPGAGGLAALGTHIASRWRGFIVNAGYRAPDAVHGVVITRCTSAAEAGAYIAKTQDGRSPGNELARGDLKTGRSGHRTPFEILESFRWIRGDADLALWHEYERATKGHQAITWSKGLRGLLAAPERTDEEIAAEEVGGEVLVIIDAAMWRKITGVPGLPGYLLDEAERGSAAAVWAVLARYGLRVRTDPG
jgi:hypothetical protein